MTAARQGEAETKTSNKLETEDSALLGLFGICLLAGERDKAAGGRALLEVNTYLNKQIGNVV